MNPTPQIYGGVQLRIVLFSSPRIWVGSAFAAVALLLMLTAKKQKRLLILIPAVFVISGFCQVTIASPLLAVIAECILLASACILSFFLVQSMMLHSYALTVSFQKFAANLVCYAAVFNLVYVLTADMRLAVYIAGTLLLLLGIANCYIFQFRGEELSFSDFVALRTALNVSKQYRFTFQPFVLSACVIFSAFVFAVSGLEYHHSGWLWPRACGLLFEMALLFAVLLFVRRSTGSRWVDEGTRLYGYLLNFFIGIKYSIVRKPAGYQLRTIDALGREFDSTFDRKKRSKVLFPEWN